MIILEDELEMLRLYLDLERLRFKNSFDYSISFYNHFDISSIFIPPLLLQPFAENAIWHGLMHKEGKGTLEVAFELENNMLNCYITDNGIGRKKAAAFKSRSAERQKSLGMQITAGRLALLNRDIEQTFLNIEDLTDEEGEATGTRVTVKIRYKESIEEFSEDNI
jgi:LytS/YehU family sensor histidine kinase